MTKDAEMVLRRLYRAYKNRRRVMGRRQAMDFLIADEDAALGPAVGVRGFGLEKHLPKIGDIFLDGVDVALEQRAFLPAGRFQ